jgi:hypothetical protein
MLSRGGSRVALRGGSERRVGHPSMRPLNAFDAEQAEVPFLRVSGAAGRGDSAVSRHVSAVAREPSRPRPRRRDRKSR